MPVITYSYPIPLLSAFPKTLEIPCINHHHSPLLSNNEQPWWKPKIPTVLSDPIPTALAERILFATQPENQPGKVPSFFIHFIQVSAHTLTLAQDSFRPNLSPALAQVRFIPSHSFLKQNPFNYKPARGPSNTNVSQNCKIIPNLLKIKITFFNHNLFRNYNFTPKLS